MKEQNKDTQGSDKGKDVQTSSPKGGREPWKDFAANPNLFSRPPETQEPNDLSKSGAEHAKLQQKLSEIGQQWVQDRTGTKEGEIPKSGAEHAELEQKLSKIGQQWVRYRETKDAGEKLSNEQRRMFDKIFPVIKEMKAIEATYPIRLHGEAARAAREADARAAREARLDSAIATIESAIESPTDSRNIAEYHRGQIHRFNEGEGRNPDTASGSNDIYQWYIDRVEVSIHNIADLTQRLPNATEQAKIVLRGAIKHAIGSIDQYMWDILTHRDVHDMIVLDEKIRSFYSDMGYVSQSQEQIFS